MSILAGATIRHLAVQRGLTDLRDAPVEESRLRSGCRASAWHAAMLLGVSVTYFACAKAGLLLASINPSATPIWPATGLALSAILLLGYRVSPAILLGAFLANATTAGSMATSGAIAVGNTLEGLVGAWFINRWSGGITTFNTPIGVARFALISLSAATPISALIGVGSLALTGYIAPDRFVPVWITWWARRRRRCLGRNARRHAMGGPGGRPVCDEEAVARSSRCVRVRRSDRCYRL